MQALIGITQLLKLCLRSNKLGIIILGITTILNAILNFYIIRLTGQFVDYIEKDFLMSQSYNNSIILILITQLSHH